MADTKHVVTRAGVAEKTSGLGLANIAIVCIRSGRVSSF